MHFSRYALLSLLTLFAAIGGDAATPIPLVGKDVYPESIAYDGRSRTFYVTSNDNGSVQRIVDGRAELLQPAGTDGRTEALGIKVDEARDRLWVSGINAIYVYRLADNRLLAKVAMHSIAPVEKTVLNDLAIDGEGNAYVTDSVNPLVVKIDGVRLTGSLFCRLPAEVSYGTINGVGYNLNGIVLSRDGKSLVAVKTNDGTLWRISIATHNVTAVRLSEDLFRGDGLVWGANESLYVLRNYNNKISKVEFAGLRDDEMHKVTTRSPGEVSVPTSAVYLALPEPQLVVVNSQFGVTPPVTPFTLVRLPAF